MLRCSAARGVTALLVAMLLVSLATLAAQPQPPASLPGTYADLDARQRALVDDWVERFARTTGQTLPPRRFFDDVLTVSSKTTFGAVTHALMTTRLTDTAGAALGDALMLVEHVESVRGDVTGAPSDRQFRIYVRLTEQALSTLERSREFKRGADNTVFHRGYPTNYRLQGGLPSVQVSVALDGRRADIDVDYRSSSFPAGLFNGHLTSSNSDVRAGNNYDRHVNRWTGFQNWWRGFFGIRQRQPVDAPREAESILALPSAPRAGRRPIEAMANDMLTAWLVEGDIVATMGYISERSYACLALDADDPSDFDRGLAPFQLMKELKAARDAIGPRDSLDSYVTGVHLTADGLRVVKQPHHARFVTYAVREDIAAAFDCESRLTPGGSHRAPPQTFGRYFGTTFFIDGHQDSPLALLWTQDRGYWKIVSWRVGPYGTAGPEAPPVLADPAPRAPADPALATAADAFLQAWLVRKDPDAAMALIDQSAYACYDIERGPAEPPSSSQDDAGRKLRASLEQSGRALGARTLSDVLSAVEPVHPAIKVMEHPQRRVFALTGPPNAMADAAECAARQAGVAAPRPLPLEYGASYGTSFRLRTRSGEAPVLWLLWRQRPAGWRVTSYGIELP